MIEKYKLPTEGASNTTLEIVISGNRWAEIFLHHEETITKLGADGVEQVIDRLKSYFFSETKESICWIMSVTDPMTAFYGKINNGVYTIFTHTVNEEDNVEFGISQKTKQLWCQCLSNIKIPPNEWDVNEREEYGNLMETLQLKCAA
jgi:hypothetical protein